MKTYILIFTDRKGNELLREKTDAENITEARKFADKKLSNSLINDLYKIIVRTDSTIPAPFTGVEV